MGPTPEPSASVADLRSDGRPLLVQVYAMILTNPADEPTVLYTTTDYGGEPTTWGVTVQLARGGTPELDDDTLTLTSGSFTPETLPEHWTSGDPTISLLFDGMTLAPECRRNPVAGQAILESSSSWPLLAVRGHPECDGDVWIDSTNEPAEWTPALDLRGGQ